MTIASEITRLQGAKADICTAIENKGVTVGDITLDDYACCIDAIEQGEKVAQVDLMVVGGGGSGGSGTSGGGGGGGGGIVFMCGALISGSNCVVIGCGGNRAVCRGGYNGGNSCFGNIVAYGGGGGAGRTTVGQNGGNGGGGGANTYGPGMGCVFQGQSGDVVSSSNGGCAGDGGGILGTNGAKYTGYTSDISGAVDYYSYGGRGGAFCNVWSKPSVCGGGCGGIYCNGNRDGGNATKYGAGGGGGADIYGYGGSGCQGIVILRYPTACGYDISGGTKYECNGYCIHCFTSDGTLTVN